MIPVVVIVKRSAGEKKFQNKIIKSIMHLIKH